MQLQVWPVPVIVPAKAMMGYAATYSLNSKNTKRVMKDLEKMMTEQTRIVKMRRLPFVD